MRTRSFKTPLWPFSTPRREWKYASCAPFLEAISLLIRENFDVFVVEAEPEIGIEQVANGRQHFPSLQIVCLVPETGDPELKQQAEQQKIKVLSMRKANVSFGGHWQSLSSHFRGNRTPAEGIDPCHSQIGNLIQFSAAGALYSALEDEVTAVEIFRWRQGRFYFDVSLLPRRNIFIPVELESAAKL